MSRTETTDTVVECPNCKKPMRWESYLLAYRPDALRGRDQKAPLAWAWHCRCGMWVYDERPPR